MVQTKSHECHLFTCSSPSCTLQLLFWVRVKLLNENTRTRDANVDDESTMNSRLRKILSTENSCRFKVWASIWLSSKLIWLLVQKQSLFYSTQTLTFIKGQTSYLVHELILHLGQSSILLTLELGFSTNWDLFLTCAQHEPFMTFVVEFN